MDTRDMIRRDINKDINKEINTIFAFREKEITREEVFTMIINSAVGYLIDKELFEESPQSDDNELVVSLMTKIIDAIEDIINRSSLPTDVIVAYGTKALLGLAKMRNI